MTALVAIVSLIVGIVIGIVVGRTISSRGNAIPDPIDDLTAVTMLCRYGV